MVDAAKVEGRYAVRGHTAGKIFGIFFYIIIFGCFNVIFYLCSMFNHETSNSMKNDFKDASTIPFCIYVNTFIDPPLDLIKLMLAPSVFTVNAFFKKFLLFFCKHITCHNIPYLPKSISVTVLSRIDFGGAVGFSYFH